MAAIQLRDRRNGYEIGCDVYAALRDGGDDEIVLTDRDALAYAFHEACGAVANAWAVLADRAGAAITTGDDRVAGRDLLEARENVTRATRIADQMMALIREASPGIVRAENES